MSEEVQAREARWQAKWREAGLATAHREEGRPKFFIIFAYPGTSGFQHLGHLRGFTFADAFARYHRMKGEVVFFPAGVHGSGLPAVVFAGKVAARDPDTIAGLLANGARESDLPKLEDPVAASAFLGETYFRTWRQAGMLVDESARTSTLDPDYQQFIRWQFQRLHQGGHLVQRPYFAATCPNSGPVSVDPSETDLAKGGNAETVVYTALPFRLPDGRALLCATLRPETVYGVTNLWVAPGESLVEWSHQGRTFLLSPEGAAKMIDQVGGSLGSPFPAATVLPFAAEVPFTGTRVPVVESSLVNPAMGTGIVMSVPAHAPADWVAVEALPEPRRSSLRKEAERLVLLEIPEAKLAPSERELFRGEGPPAARAVRSLKVRGLDDREPLREATERTYRAEHRHGVMSVPPFQGVPVAVARRQVAERATSVGGGFELREFSEPVICRCGAAVVIRRVPDQWFLGYGDAPWKAQVRARLPQLSTFPPEYRDELPAILDWFEDRPAVRRGKWLGTPFPLDPQWIIEPIADSTLYPAYYVVRRFVGAQRLTPEQLTPAFFDFVFRGEGPGEPSVAKELQEEVRRDFLYFYPLDVNLGGKEHKRVHFPVFLYNHLALLSPDLQPKAIYVNWWITGAHGKLSKKDVKGGAVPEIGEGLARLGADGTRLHYASGATPFQDTEWDGEACERARDRCEEVLRLVQGLRSAGPAPPSSSERTVSDPLSRWFSTALHEALVEVRGAFDAFDLHRAAEIVYVRVPSLLRRYRSRGGSDPALLAALGETWTRLLSPITPHLAEEAAEGHGTGLVSVASFPTGAEFPSYPGALAREALQDQLEEDIASLLRTWKAPASELRIFVAAPWKRSVEVALREALSSGASPDVGGAMKALKARPELQAFLGRVPSLLQLYDLRALAAQPPGTAPPEPSAEVAQWQGAASYLRERFSLSTVKVLSEEEGAASDPKGRRARARPGRPALLLVDAGT